MSELPNPLVACTRCHRHAAFYRGERPGEWFCGYCGPEVSLFCLPPSRERKALQVNADEALRASGEHDLLGTYAPLTGIEGD